MFEDTLPFLDGITVPVCIVSNIDRVDLESAVAFHSIKVANIVTSEDARSYKPRPEIFMTALKLMNVKPAP